MPLEPIPWYRADEFEYVLQILRRDDGESRVLMREGEEVEQLSISPRPGGGRREVRRREGETVSTEVYDATGRLVRKESFDNGEATAIETMTYSAGRLAESENRTPDGEVLWRDRFVYDSEGLLRRVVRAYPSGDERRSEYTFQGGSLLQEWHGNGGAGILIRYGAAGREVARENWDGDVLVTRESFEYADSGVIRRSVVTDFAEDSRTVVTYDADGRPVAEERTVGETVASTVTYEYDGEDLAVRREESGEGLLETRYEYEGGEIAAESFYTDGLLTKRILYPEEGRRVEERFRVGDLFLRIYFEDDVRTREEVIRNGTVVQERSYQ